MSEWQPIEAALKQDGVPVDLWIEEHSNPKGGMRLTNAYWDERNQRWYTEMKAPIANWYWVSHWMPVPTRPKSLEQKRRRS